jgi:hypothetical protein
MKVTAILKYKLNHTKLSIGVITAAAIASMLVLGTTLSPVQQSFAHGKSAKAIFNPEFINVNKNDNQNKNGGSVDNAKGADQQQQQQQQQQQAGNSADGKSADGKSAVRGGENPEHNTATFKHEIRSNAQHKDQHMDQENLCLRGEVCKNSNVGLQTLGNDNSVTGFADQSGNNSTSDGTQ